MPHNPVKSIKIDFHTADGMIPKPTDMGMDAQTGGGMQEQPAPQSKLSPLHEILFKHWATANGIQDTDAPDNHYDYRGMFQQSGGQMQPPGAIQGAADGYNRIKQNPIQPMPSHSQAPQLTSPGMPSVEEAMAQKQQVMQDQQGQDQSPIHQLIRLLSGGQ